VTTANKIAKYGELENTCIFFSVAIETASAWNHMAIELVQEISQRITAVTEQPRVHVPVLVSRVAFWGTSNTE